VSKVIYHMGNKKLQIDECATLDYDPFRYAILLLNKLLNLKDKPKNKKDTKATKGQFD
jgi:hypothetical protein